MNRTRARRVICAVLLCCILSACFALPTLAAEAAPFNILLSWTKDPATSITAAWRDSVQRVEVLQLVPETQYRQSGFDGAAEAAAVCRDIRVGGDAHVWHYEATAEGLLPGTSYVYRVGCAGAWSEPRYFTTDEPGADTLTFAYLGDVQPAGDATTDYAAWGELVRTVYARHPELRFAVLGGDMVNSGIAAESFDLLAASTAGVFDAVPLFAAAGNHESNFPGGKPELMLDYFAFPENGPEGFTEEFYSFNCGSCHVLVLNSWVYSGEQKLGEADFARLNRWIAADLAASTADWQIVVLHVPVYAVHSDGTAEKLRENWAPIFEQYGADLVLEGHQHVYSRSYPLYQGKIDEENGVTYIMGVSGSKFYSSADETRAQRTIYETSVCQIVQICADTLTVQTVDAQGAELDFVQLRQRPCQQLYSDVTEELPCFRAAAYASAAGLFSGVGGGSFAPEGAMTRAMFATVLHRFAGLPESGGETSFADVPAGTWYADAVNWAAENGLVSGYGDGRFGPDDRITLEQMLAVLYRFTGAEVSDEAPLPEGCGPVSAWAADALRWAGETGLLSQVEGTLHAQESATRAQVAELFLALYRG